MTDHLVHVDAIHDGYVQWRFECCHVPGGQWRVTLPDGELDPNFDECDCWLMSWWDAMGSELLYADAPITSFPIAVEPHEWSYDDGGTLEPVLP